MKQQRHSFKSVDSSFTRRAYLDSRQTFADFLEFAAAEVLAQLYTGPLEIPIRKKEKSSKSPLFLSDMKQNKKETKQNFERLSSWTIVSAHAVTEQWRI